MIFIASYPASEVLKNWDGAVLSIHASNDGLSTPEDIEMHKTDLPVAYEMTDKQNFSLPLQSKTHYFEIAGGNHAQFGSYGKQSGDNEATISSTDQQTILVQVLNNFISKL